MQKIQRIIYRMRKSKGPNLENDRWNRDKSSQKGKSFSKEKNPNQNFKPKAPISSKPQKMEKRLELDEIIITPAELEVTLDNEWSYFTIESKANEEITIELEFFPEELKSYLTLTTDKKRSNKSTLKKIISYHLDLKPKSKKTIYINIKEADPDHTSRYILYGIKDRLSNKSPQLIVKVVKEKEKIELKRLPFIISEKRRKPKNVDSIQSNKNDINNNRTSSVAKSNVIPFSVSVDNPLKLFDSKKPSELEKDNYEFKKDIIESTKAKDRINTTNYSIKHSDPNLNSKLLSKNITSSIDTIDTFDTSLKPSKFNEVNSEVKEDTNIGKGKAKEKADNSNNLVRLSYVSLRNLKVIITYCQDEKFIKERLESRLIKKLEGTRNTLQDEMFIDKSNEWYQKFQNHIAGANVLIMLISEAFLNSKFILNENVRKLLADCKNKGLYIMPVVARICLWREVKLWTQLGIEVFHNKGKALICHGGTVFDGQLDKIVIKIMDFFSSAKAPVQGFDNHPPPKANDEEENNVLSMYATENKTNEIKTNAPSPKNNKTLNNQYDKDTVHCFELLKIVLDDFEKICDLINQYMPSITREESSDFSRPTYLKTIQRDILPKILQYLESLKKDESMGDLVSCLLQSRKENFSKAPFSKFLKGKPEEHKALVKDFQERIKKDLTLMIFDPFFCKMAIVRKENKVISAESMVRLEEIYKYTLNFFETHLKLKAISITLGQSRYNAEEHEIAGYEETSAPYRPRTIIGVQKWGYQSLMGKKRIEKAKVFLNGRVR